MPWFFHDTFHFPGFCRWRGHPYISIHYHRGPYRRGPVICDTHWNSSFQTTQKTIIYGLKGGVGLSWAVYFGMCTKLCFWKQGLEWGAVFDEGGCSLGVPLYTYLFILMCDIVKKHFANISHILLWYVTHGGRGGEMFVHKLFTGVHLA